MPPSPPLELPLKYYLPLAISVVAALIILFTPASGVPSGFEHSDKIVHFCLFAALAYSSRVAAISARWTAVWTVTFAGLSEALQAVLPLGRSGSLDDALFDVFGVTAGLLIAALVAPSRSAIH
ncbi:VanZ family protein [Rhodococcoides yunnanense]|uniref:VanZ family protein n=1 Tax=Rhodococcoides yunnanense TaxID=278209 RepID=UPI0022B12290|nr:VanZ family protein [Rhodococcus yunnanensis]MCZ4276017.1 VanZ family protein [Rhodococcus yunnanensis]